MTQLKIILEVRFLRIPVRWELRQTALRRPSPEEGKGILITDETEPILVPYVDQSVKRHINEIDGFELRRQFLRLDHTEQAALDFLQQVGVWRAVESHTVSQSNTGAALLSGSFGSRFLTGRALPIRVSDLWREQEYALRLLRDTPALKATFGTPPPASAAPYKKLRFALETRLMNELPIHVEWRRGLPFGVAEIVTGRELLMATMHADLLRGAKIRNCARKDCGIPFPVTSGHNKKYCDWSCAHVAAVRASRAAKKKEMEKRYAKER